MRAGDHPYLLVPGEEAELATLAGLVDRSLRGGQRGRGSYYGRLDETHNRQLDADRVIDTAIAMEAILSWRAKGEFSYERLFEEAILFPAWEPAVKLHSSFLGRHPHSVARLSMVSGIPARHLRLIL